MTSKKELSNTQIMRAAFQDELDAKFATRIMERLVELRRLICCRMTPERLKEMFEGLEINGEYPLSYLDEEGTRILISRINAFFSRPRSEAELEAMAEAQKLFSMISPEQAQTVYETEL